MWKTLDIGVFRLQNYDKTAIFPSKWYRRLHNGINGKDQIGSRDEWKEYGMNHLFPFVPPSTKKGILAAQQGHPINHYETSKKTFCRTYLYRKKDGK